MTDSPVSGLLSLLDQCTTKDASPIQTLIDRIVYRYEQGKPYERDFAKAQELLKLAMHRYQRRVASIPAVSYDLALPIVQAKEELLALIATHQVVVIAGETGSGKTTQIPKLCLELGRGAKGLIGHTQPRRLAATSVAKRIAQELNVNLGEQVGYAIRFDQKCSDDSLLAVMTDGVLLQELKNDPLLLRYDTLIIDEAHERSLNIDLILGYLKHLLPKRPDLKLIITSATIDPHSFSCFFNDAPMISVSGRTYPVEVWYQPLTTDDSDVEDVNLVEGVARAISACRAHGPGDVMVFLSGEAEIRNVAKHLRQCAWSNTEVLPLYARLSMADQQKVFSTSNKTRIVLATNVAETSLTVPGIRYVVDSGSARISRYSQSSRVQRLPIEPISQASANQRKGRCGRVMSGVCVRLYSEADFLARDEYSTPEILRTNLSALLLQMLSLGLKDIEDFEFIDAPDKKRIKDGLKLLEDLGAIDGERQLLTIGRQMSALPLPPQLSRILIAAANLGCLGYAILICAFLCIRDPRERPVEKSDQAVGLHRRFHDPESDFLAIINLWDHVHKRKAELSSNQWRKELKQEFLNGIAIIEWGRLVAHLKTLAQELGLKNANSTLEYSALHKALVTGFIHQIGQQTRDGDYQGARNIRFAAHSGSGLHRKMKPWVVAADFLDGQRLYGLHLARVEPEWLEQIGAHLIKSTRADPHWRESRGDAAVIEQVTLFGLLIVPKRSIPLAKTDPALAREFMVRHGFLRNEWDLRAGFMQHNLELMQQVHEQEERARRRDLLMAEDDLLSLLLARLPEPVVDKFSLIKALKSDKKLDSILRLTEAEIQKAGSVSESDFPPEFPIGDMVLPLRYSFSPGDEKDGVTATLSLPQLAQVTDSDFERLVPGLLAAKLEAMLRALPKETRKLLHPINESLERLLTYVQHHTGTLSELISAWIYQTHRTRVEPSTLHQVDIPPHLVMRFEVFDDKHQLLSAGRSVSALQARLAVEKKQSLKRHGKQFEQTGLRQFPDAEIAAFVESAGTRIYLALKDEQISVGVKAYANEDEAHYEHRRGLARLIALACDADVKQFMKSNKGIGRLQLAIAAIQPAKTLIDDWVFSATLEFLPADVTQIRQQSRYQELLQQAPKALRIRMADSLASLTHLVTEAADVLTRCQRQLSEWPEHADDIEDQIRYLLEPGFLAREGLSRIADLQRYVSAMLWRADRLKSNVPQDAQRMQRWHDALNTTQASLRPLLPIWTAKGLAQKRLQVMLNEYSVALFAQHIKTAESISDKRIQQFVLEHFR